MNLYKEYRALSSKEKRKRIDDAEQSEIHRKENPQGTFEFDEFEWLNFQVEEENKLIKLHTYRQNARGNMIGVIFMFHGLNSHIGHGAHIAAYFSDHGFTTIGFDHRGFGRSEGREGYVNSLSSHLEDSHKFLSMTLPLYEKYPKFLLGLSMGGMTSFHISLENPTLFDGVVLMAPALKNSVGGTLVKAAKILGSFLPEKTKLTKPVYGRASKNPVITEFVKKDKYAFSERMYVSTMAMLVKAMDESPKRFHEYKAPFMIIQGGLDKLVCPEVAFDLYDKSQTAPEDKELLFYENMWHDIWHEDEIHEIMPKILTWLKKRISKRENEISKKSGENIEHKLDIKNSEKTIENMKNIKNNSEEENN